MENLVGSRLLVAWVESLISLEAVVVVDYGVGWVLFLS